MGSDDFKMPAFGVGPIYVLSCLFLTTLGIMFRDRGYLKVGCAERGRLFFCRLRHFIFIGRHLSLGSCGGLSTNQRKSSGAEAFDLRRLRLRSKSRLQRLFIYLYRGSSFRRQLPLAPTAYSLLGDAHGVNEADGGKVVAPPIR